MTGFPNNDTSTLAGMVQYHRLRAVVQSGPKSQEHELLVYYAISNEGTTALVVAPARGSTCFDLRCTGRAIR